MDNRHLTPPKPGENILWIFTGLGFIVATVLATIILMGMLGAVINGWMFLLEFIYP